MRPGHKRKNSLVRPRVVLAALACLFMFDSSAVKAQDYTSNLVSHWRMDETSGTTAADSAGSNNGTLTNMAGTEWTPGRVAGALDFDGTDDYVDVGNIALVDGAAAATVCAWVRPDGFSNDGVLLGDWDGNVPGNGGLFFWLDTAAFNSGRSNTVSFTADVGVTAERVEGSTNLVETGTWQHYCGVFSGGSYLRLYKNAQLDMENTTSVSATVATGNYVSIGDTLTGAGRNLNGPIDDVRVYNRALSADDIMALYTDERSGNLRYNTAYRTLEYHDGVNWRGIDRAGKPTEDGLAGHWKLDETTGVTAVDATGNNNGTLVNSPTWNSNGAIGGSLRLDDASSQYVDIGDVLELPLPITMAAWVRLDSVAGAYTIVTNDKDNAANHSGVWMQTNGDQLMISYGDGNASGSASRRTLASPAGVLTVDTWHHVVGVVRGATDMNLYVDGTDVGGTYSGSGGAIQYNTGHTVISSSPYPLPGLVDDVRIYSRDLSATEVQNLYNYTYPAGFNERHGLLGHWRLDETSGTTATDSSGNGNDGTLITMDPNTDWVTGQIGGALDFDGVNEYVDMGSPAILDNLSSLTVCAWVFPRSGYTSSFPLLVDKTSGNAYQNGWNLYLNSETNKRFGFFTNYQAYKESTNGTIELDTWQHLCATWDGSAGSSGINNYHNGIIVGVQTSSGGNASPDDDSAQNLRFGLAEDGSLDFKGILDDVRIFGRILSADEVYALYAWGYQGGATCSNPAGDPGRIIYNTTHEVMQYCDGTAWQPMGPVPGTGGAACSSPAGDRGAMIFNTTYNVMQYCDGTNWRTIAQRN